MSVVTKALRLLQYFSASRPEIGLSDLRRLAKHDKATTYRYLQALEEAGFIEKNPTSRAYRIGPAVLHLAQMRELTVPRTEGARAALVALADATGETAHLSVLSGTELHAIAAHESPKHSSRAIVDLQILPLHATASGQCALAFGPDDLTEYALRNLVRYTQATAATELQLKAAIKTAQQSGFGYSNRGLEDDVTGLAAPLFDQTNALAGTIAVAGVASRITPQRETEIKIDLITASREITRNWGGRIPASIEDCWSLVIAQSKNRILP